MTSVQSRKEQIRNAFDSAKFRWDEDIVRLKYVAGSVERTANRQPPVFALYLDNTPIIEEYFSGNTLRHYVFILHGELPYGGSRLSDELDERAIRFELFMHEMMDYLLEYRHADDGSDLGILSYEPVGNAQDQERGIFSYTISFVVRRG